MLRSIKRDATRLADEAEADAGDLLETLGAQTEDTARRTFGQVKRAYDNTVDQTLRLIKENPFGVVVAVGTVAFAIGALIFATSRRR